MTRRTARYAVASAAILALAATSFAGTGTAYAAADRAALESAAAATALATAPTDAQLARAADSDLVRPLVRCVPIEGMQYCLHHGSLRAHGSPDGTFRLHVEIPGRAA